MTRVMYDSTDPNAIPVPVQMVAGYVTGFDQNWPPAAWARFGNAVQVRVCTRGNVYAGDVLDMESGAASASDAVPWLQQMLRQTGEWKSLYYSLSLDPQIQANLAAAGVPSAQVPKWIAWYNGHAGLDDVSGVVGVVAKQYANSKITGHDYDMSVVADYWPGVDGDPAPFEEESMVTVINTGAGLYAVDYSGSYVGISNYTGPVLSMTPDEFNSLVGQRQAAYAKLGAGGGSGGGTAHVHSVSATTSSAG